MGAMHVEFYFDFSCPYAYIASTRIESLCARAGAALSWRPMLLGGVFQAAGQANSPMTQMNPAKMRHNILDMQRWAEHTNIPLVMPANHPMRTVRALRALLTVPEAQWPAVIHAFYRAYWQQGEDITTTATVEAVLAAAGLDQGQIQRAVAANDDPTIKDELRRRTDEAASRKIFGAPTMFVHVPDTDTPLMFWGQDRLHMVAAVLAGWRPGHNAPPALSGTLPPASEQPPTLHFWYDFSSPFAYLGASQIERIAAHTGAQLIWRPMLLGALFRDIGTANVPLLDMPPAKRDYIGRDLEHWASYWQVPFRFPEQFPMRTVTALRLALQAGDRIAELNQALFRAYWVEGRNIDDPDTLSAILRDRGFAAEAMMEGTRDPAIKQQLIANTSEAVAAGVFGAPTTVIKDPNGDLLFWGQDRLQLVESVLRGWRPRSR